MSPGRRPAGPAPLDPRRVGQLVHDLNTPIAALKLQLFLHRSALGPRLSERDLHSLDLLDRNVDRLGRIVAALAPSVPMAPPGTAATPAGPHDAPQGDP